eukprot:478678-Pyramimonas_sp.AAC.1
MHRTIHGSMIDDASGDAKAVRCIQVVRGTFSTRAQHSRDDSAERPGRRGLVSRPEASVTAPPVAAAQPQAA